MLSNLMTDHVYRVRVSMKNSAGTTTIEYQIRTSDSEHPYVYQKPSLDSPELISLGNSSSFFNNHLGFDMIPSDAASGHIILTIMIISTVLLGAIASIIILYRIMQKKLLNPNSLSSMASDNMIDPNNSGTLHALNGNGKIPFIPNNMTSNNGGSDTLNGSHGGSNMIWTGNLSELAVLRSSATLDRRFFSKKMRNSTSDSAFNTSQFVTNANLGNGAVDDVDPNLDHQSSTITNCHNMINSNNHNQQQQMMIHNSHQGTNRSLFNDDQLNQRRLHNQHQQDSINPYSHPQIQFLTIARRSSNSSSCPKTLLTSDHYSVVQRKPATDNTNKSNSLVSHHHNLTNVQCLETSLDFIQSSSGSGAGSTGASPTRYSTPKVLTSTSSSFDSRPTGGNQDVDMDGHNSSGYTNHKLTFAPNDNMTTSTAAKTLCGDDESTGGSSSTHHNQLQRDQSSPAGHYRCTFFTDADDYCQVDRSGLWRSTQSSASHVTSAFTTTAPKKPAPAIPDYNRTDNGTKHNESSSKNSPSVLMFNS